MFRSFLRLITGEANMMNSGFRGIYKTALTAVCCQAATRMRVRESNHVDTSMYT